MPDHPRNLRAEGGRHTVGSKKLRIMRAAPLQITCEVQRVDTRITSAQGSRLQLETSDVPGRGSPSTTIAFAEEARPPGWTTMSGLASRSGWLSVTPLLPIKPGQWEAQCLRFTWPPGPARQRRCPVGRALLALPSASLLRLHCPFPFVSFHPLNLSWGFYT